MNVWDRDAFLYEAIGLCLHVQDYEYKNPWYEFPKCRKCGKQTPDINRQASLSTWEGFGILMEHLVNAEWYVEFMKFIQCDTNALFIYYIHPDRLADKLYTFLKERK